MGYTTAEIIDEHTSEWIKDRDLPPSPGELSGYLAERADEERERDPELAEALEQAAADVVAEAGRLEGEYSEPEPAAPQLTLERYTEWQQAEGVRLAARAREAIARARGELDSIELELEAARTGLAYRRIGRIDGVDAQAIFDAFGTLERAAQLRAALEREAVARG
jgi:hypothetical protein